MKILNKANGCIYGNHQKLFTMKLLSNENGWVEGFIDSFNKENKEERRFVFGVFYPGQVIELFKSPLSDINTVLNFHLENNFNDYKGQVLTMGEPNQELYGLCSLIMQQPKLDSESTEVVELEQEMEAYKKGMDSYEKAFYYESFLNRDKIMKVVADSYRVQSDIKQLLKRL